MIVRHIIFVILMLWVIYQDFKDMTIPDAVHVGLLTNAFLFNVLTDEMPVRTACYGFLIGGVFLMILFLFGGMGLGDVKLMAALGTWFGLAIINVILLSFIVGLIFALAFYIKTKNRKAQVPFGPSIATAAMIIWFSGISLIGI